MGNGIILEYSIRIYCEKTKESCHDPDMTPVEAARYAESSCQLIDLVPALVLFRGSRPALRFKSSHSPREKYAFTAFV